jgi:DnaJ-class molecular chaperone
LQHGTGIKRIVPEAGQKIILVYNAGMAKKEKNKVCDVCGGSGQISFFKGVSRFLLSNEECEVCAGTGVQLNSAADNNNKVEKTTKEKKE